MQLTPNFRQHKVRVVIFTCQSVHKQIQRNNLTSRYGNDQNFSLLIRHIPALAFLSPVEIAVAFGELKELLLKNQLLNLKNQLLNGLMRIMFVEDIEEL